MSTIDQDRANLLRTRRDFFRTAGCAALSSIGVASTIRDFRLVNSALAQNSGPFSFSDYKAMVCIFLGGGNDSNNLIIPRGPAHAAYANIRQNLTIPESSLLPLDSLSSDGNDYGLHPACPELAALFHQKKAAFLFNVGPLLFPVTRIQYQKKTVALPPQLFSHSDQVTHWQTSLPDLPPRTGWGGRVADLLHPYQNELLNDPANRAKISLCTSIAGANTFEVGSTVQQYHVSTSGAVTLAGAAPGSARETVVRNIAQLNQSNLQTKVLGEIVDDAIATGALLNSAIAPTASWTWTTPFPVTSIGNQMKMIARIIAARGALKIKRQIFFVSVGGYDTHTAQLNNATPTTGNHANLLGELSEAIGAFQAAIEQISAHATYGDPALANSVIGFTGSDFGRTFPTNGQGSDHGWGGHHIIFGGNGNAASGAVRGQRTYGKFPVHQINGPDDTSTGRWIPTTSVDEYSATLAKWFGVDATHMSAVFPNIGRFPNPDLGFLNT